MIDDSVAARLSLPQALQTIYGLLEKMNPLEFCIEPGDLVIQGVKSLLEFDKISDSLNIII